MYRFIQNISNFLARFGKDRYLHFIVSLILTQFLAAALHILGAGNHSLIAAPLIVICLGFAKEWMDERNGGEFEPYDIVWDFLGMFAGLVLMILILA
ncbi:MAG: hypothetical protein IJ363_13985 [Clostridia bacterium]|nr:hypothetical protein [Clostridia bacterium]